MQPRPAKPRRLLLSAVILAHIVWRTVCFCWGPLNLSTWPGAGFESSAIAASGLLVVWLVLGDAPLQRRVIQVGLLYIVLRFALDLGVFLHAYRRGMGEIQSGLDVFRRVEDEVLACCFVFAIALRWLTGRRITSRGTDDSSQPRVQFRLLHLFLFTGVFSLLLALAKAHWFQIAGKEDFGIPQILFLHAVTIALAIFPALLMLLPRLSFYSLGLLVATWGTLPLIIALYFHFAAWFPIEWELIRHLITTVVGPAVAAASLAFALRRSGYRWRALPIPAKRALPAHISVDL